eukprot:667498-Rhodomonas_salina.1
MCSPSSHECVPRASSRNAAAPDALTREVMFAVETVDGLTGTLFVQHIRTMLALVDAEAEPNPTLWYKARSTGGSRRLLQL